MLNINSEYTFRSDMTVELKGLMAQDIRVIEAARVSTKGSDSAGAPVGDIEMQRFIDFLMRNRHGSPFEHCVFTFLISAPIFVWREIMRHRIASYNEESGRYKQLDPVFYVPGDDRNMKQVGKPGEYSFEPVSIELMTDVQHIIAEQTITSYKTYEYLLAQGIAREVSRMVLPVNIYSSAWMTINARSLMNFLSLRVRSDESLYPSTPQHEINLVAIEMEKAFQAAMPLTHEAFVKRGRVAP